MMKFTTSVLLFLCLFLTDAAAQLSEGGTPISNRVNLSANIPVVTMPSIDAATLIEEDKRDIANNNPLRFAFGHKTNLDLNNAGKWENLPNGDRVWRLTVSCPDAKNINFLYRDFFIPEGAKLFIFNENKTQVLGAFTSANNKKNRKFATALIHSDTAIIEYFEPKSVRNQGSINIAQVAQGYRSMNNPLDAEDTGSLGNSGACQVNVNCEEGDDWQDEKKGVGKIVMDGLYLCSGNLVNNTANDCKPYFLTANHCIMGGVLQDAIINPDVSGYIFYWNFEYHDCENSGFVSEQTTSGGTVVANSGIAQTGTHTFVSSDFALIELDESPRDRYDVYFNGWDAGGSQGSTGVGIHHPAGDAKKISTHSVVPSLNTYYWDLYWDATTNGQSVTEGGSSGSSLFRETGHVIGQLFGGGSVNCDDPANDLAKYGRLDYSWVNTDSPDSSDPRRRLNVWLDPIGGGSITLLDGTYNPCNTRQVYFHQSDAVVNEGEADTESGCLAYKDYTYDIGITPFPLSTITAEIQSVGSAANGQNRDFEILNSTVEFGGPFAQQTFTVRVFDDKYPEATENAELTFVLTGENVEPMPALSLLNITINDNDELPNTHVQSVESTTKTEYLGPFGKVYFKANAPEGMMMSIENLSSHDYGCTSVRVDNAGANADNSYDFVSTAGKTFELVSEFPNEEAAVKVTLYYTASEVQGFEVFNNADATIEEVSVLYFAGGVAPENQNTIISQEASLASYGNNNTTLSADFAGLSDDIVGFTFGAFTDALFRSDADEKELNQKQELLDFTLTPNPVRDEGILNIDLKTAFTGVIDIIDFTGKRVWFEQVKLNSGNNTKFIDTSDFQPGMYMVILSTEEGFTQTSKLIKTN